MTEPETFLFDLDAMPVADRIRRYKTLQTRVWTHTKAQFIARYLQCFVYVTRHGTYLDAFAGPQDLKKHTCWAARLVLKNRPEMLRHFVFFEKSSRGVQHLTALKEKEGGKRDVQIIPGDSNVTLPMFLAVHPIKEKEATFCLLDQRCFECDWETVKTIAAHKKSGNKIELLYFLAQGWLNRSLAALKQPEERMARWWGNDTWRQLAKANEAERPAMMARRFKDELGYKFAHSFPIFKKGAAGRIMFFLIHASDHPEAPVLMTRAYNNEMKEHQPPAQGQLMI